MKKRLPKLSPLDVKESEALGGHYNGRLVDFREAFIYDKNLTINYL